MAETRNASVTWNGDLMTGAGTIDYVSSGVFARMPVSWASRTSAHNGKTSPEELLAAAHASCFSMAFSSRLAKNGTPATSLKIKAEVLFDNAGGGWKVTTSTLTVVGDVPGIDLATFEAIADDAKENCPISIALKGNVELRVVASLAGA
ncbi:MAG: OsmC family peroxiredoxin [Chloroflexota bacterium]